MMREARPRRDALQLRHRARGQRAARLRVARAASGAHPSESEEYLIARVLAYLLEFGGHRVLVTSHNANLVVLTDADLIIHVDSDDAQSSFPTAGFLSCVTSHKPQHSH